jgi:hypothetical protein
MNGYATNDEARITDDQMDAAVSSAVRHIRAPVRGLPLLWETGYLGFVMGNSPLLASATRDPMRMSLVPQQVLGDVRPRLQDLHADTASKPASASAERTDAASTVARKRRIDDITIQDPNDAKLDDALRTWRGLVGEMGDSCVLYRQLVACETDQLANRTFAAVFHGKPAGTLMKRASSMRMYVRWARAARLSPFPLTEEIVFRYVDDLGLEGAPPTRARSFTEALNFSKGYVGLGGVTDILSSRRVQGAASASYSRKREVRKRFPLTKVECIKLETLLSDSSAPPRDRILAGFLLMCLYSRVRVGDATRIKHEPTLDVAESGHGYLEAGMHEHKTSARVRAIVSLPVAGPAVGIGGTNWAEQWLALRRESGLNAERDRCLTRTPGIDGTWSHRRLSTQDCSVWFREVLSRITPMEPERLRSIGSHSLKATLLSWLAKFGVSPASRRRLGGHVKPGDRTMAEYSRDELAGPLRDLDRVLTAVRLGVFAPDNTRSGRFAHDDGAAEVLAEDFPGAETPRLSAPSSDSCSSDSSTVSELVDTDDSSSDDAQICAVAVEVASGSSRHEDLPEAPASGLVRNLANGILHGARDTRRLLCGRAYPQQCAALSDWPVKPWPLCRDCFRQASEVQRGAKKPRVDLDDIP